MAEGFLRTMLGKENIEADIRSAGLFASDGAPISAKASSLLKEKGFEQSISSKRLSDESVEWADLILTMTMNHKQHVAMQYPEAVEKVYTLKEYVEEGAKSQQEQQERERTISEIQIKLSLGQELTKEETKKWEHVQLSYPDYDIADPFGGTEEDYRRCAEELEHVLKKLVEKLKNGERN